MNTTAIIDYGMGNLHSIAKAVEHVRPGRVLVTSRVSEILAADRVVFPGQGAARDCMREIHAAGLEDVIRTAIEQKPFFGVCMGLQVLFERSEEGGGTTCLSVFPGVVRFFGEQPIDAQHGARLKIPQMGWNQVHHERSHPLWEGIPNDSRFYFVHSYYVDPVDDRLIAGTTEYSVRYPSAIAHGNLFAVQFHPEKSQQVGLQLLRNFLHWDGKS